MSIELIIGTEKLGQLDQDDAKNLVAAIRKQRSVLKTIDTSAIYPLIAPGVPDKAMGEAEFGRDGYLVNTKTLFYLQGGCYTRDGVQSTVSNSLKSRHFKFE